ncbi:MAG TPA: helix-turn-helix transcriptional regulator [Pseudolabrys sp.]|nr:helix-turn-helix transcriptional regulator [Pseudolabrys sp.]
MKIASDGRGLLENALRWLADGAALLRADGSIVYANDTLQAFAKRGDGFRITDRNIEFLAPEARRRFDTTLAAVTRPRESSPDARPADFPVPRNYGVPAYIVSMRPLAYGEIRTTWDADAAVILLVRDPLYRNVATSQILRDLFGLTNAEAQLAEALCTGTTTAAYANARHLSLNTVYSHLKRIREKTGCKSLPELIRKFGELNVPLRPA